MAKKAAVLFANGFEEIEAVAPLDILRRAGAEVTAAGVGGKALVGSRGLKMTADVEVECLIPDLDLLVLPGGGLGAKNLGQSPKARELAEQTLATGGIVGAICAAPVTTLAAWGLLSGKKAACFPGMENQFPRDVVFSPEPVVVDGNIVTSRGAGTTLLFSLALVGKLLGEDKAEEIAKSIVFL